MPMCCFEDTATAYPAAYLQQHALHSDNRTTYYDCYWFTRETVTHSVCINVLFRTEMHTVMSATMRATAAVQLLKYSHTA